MCGGFAVISSFVAPLVGGFDSLIKAMGLLMVMDIITGLISAGLFNTSKYSKNGLTSDALMKGAVRKIMMLFIVSLAVMVDSIIKTNYIRNCAVLYFIATEGLSIIEHMVHMGVPFPSFIKTMLDVLLEKADSANGNTADSNKSNRKE